MQDTTTIEARLSRAGLDQEQVQAAIEENAADLDGFQQWLDTVHDDDIKERHAEAAGQSEPGGAGALGNPGGGFQPGE